MTRPVCRARHRQVTIFDVEVHSSELELLKGAADEYDWEAIKAEVEPIFKEVAKDFRNRKRNFVCPHKDKEEEDLPVCVRSRTGRQERFPFLDEIEQDISTANINPKGAGRKGQDFISYLKVFELAPVIRVEQN